MLSVEIDDSECGRSRAKEDEPHNHSLRWHLNCNDRTFIVYADSIDDASAIFVRKGLTGFVQPSGYYCQRANAIYQAKDGPTVYVDNSNGRLT